MSEINTRVLWEKETKRSVPSDGIKLVLEFHVVIDPSKLAGISKNNGYNETIIPLELVQVLGKTKHNTLSSLLNSWKPNKGFKYGNLYADNSAVADLQSLGSSILKLREPEPVTKTDVEKALKSNCPVITLSFDDIGENDASDKALKVQDSRFDLIKNYHAPKARQSKLDTWNQFLVDNWGNSATKYKEIFHSEFFKDVTHDYEYMLARIGDKCKVAPFSEDVYKGLLIEVQAHS